MNSGGLFPKLACLLVCALAVAPSKSEAQESTHSQLVRLNHDLLESAIVRRDNSLVLANALDELLVIPPGGIVENKDDVLRGIANFGVTEISLADLRVLIHGPTAVIVARLELTGEGRPSGRMGPLRVMSVFVNSDGTWRLLARSLTPCAERAIAAERC